MSIIARTAGIGRSAPELQWDLNYLLNLWNAIDGATKGAKGAYLIYQESSLVIRAIRDYFNGDIGEILIDTDDIFEQAHQFMSHVMPEHGHRVKRYRDDAPLFSRFQIEHQIETAYSRTVNLPSGGAIVIDQTEALVAVDVNSARAIKGGDIEETATRTNLEAADEVARQMRLRDLGGLIVIDFIDMEESRNRREVENRLRDALRQDRARVQFGTISKFGLMEMSRQRLRPALSEGASIPCPRCGGSGHIRDTESSALQILRIIQEEAQKDNTASVLCQVPVDVASFLLNEKRTEIAKIELKQRINVLMVPNKSLETPNYKLERLKHDDPRLDNIEASYKMAEEVEDPTSVTRRSQEPTNKQTPVIKGVLPDAPAPIVAPKPVVAQPQAAKPAHAAKPAAAAASTGFFGWLKNLFGGAPAAEPVKTGEKKEERREGRGGRGGEGRGRGEGRGGEGRSEGRTEGRGEGRGRGGRGGRGGRDGEGRGRGERQGQRGEADNKAVMAEATTQGNEAAKTEQRQERAPRNGEQRGRGDRAERGEGRAEQGERGERTEQRAPRGERAERGENRGEGRGERGERGEGRGGRRGERPPRQDDTRQQPVEEVRLNDEGTAITPVAAPAMAVTESQTAVDVVQQAAPETAAPTEGEGGNGQRERRSRDRYGRDRQRGERGERGERQERSPLEAAPAESQPAAAPASAPAPAAETRAPATTAAPAPAARALPRVQTYALPLGELNQIADTAGLQWVNSDADKVAAVQAAIAAEPKPVHVPRERPAPVVIDEGPLILVETRKDLRDLNLPFEQQSVQS
ncbi:MAG: Rne/Rng family ribonuclease, partial [Hylemonella sp.]|nr:Rne/Rng family ribonuclease [Hylemonella sp.]